MSSEPCSTRPNPFDDDELSARKRRRTSLSGGASPSRSTGPVMEGSSQDLGVEPPEAGPSAEGSKMKVDADPTRPHTPDQEGADGPGPSVEPVSSRVTINLRNTQRSLDTIPSSPLSSKSPASTTQPPEPHVDDVKASVEESEVDMSQGGTSGSTPISSTMDGGSPPIKVLDPQPDGDGDPEFSSNQPTVNMIEVMEEDDSGFVDVNGDDDDEVLEDPTPEFPYRNEGEHQQESVNRVNQHILACRLTTLAPYHPAGAFANKNGRCR